MMKQIKKLIMMNQMMKMIKMKQMKKQLVTLLNLSTVLDL